MLCSIQAPRRGMAPDGAVRASHCRLPERCGELVQALAFWAAYYPMTAPTIAITKDVDLLGTRADVERLARGDHHSRALSCRR